MARKIINSTFMTLDGGVENPHLWPSLGDQGSQESHAIQDALLQDCDAILMGRKTYESFAAVWPTRSGDRFADRMNSMRKYVASSTLKDPVWNNTTVVGADVVQAMRRIKNEPGKSIVQYGLGAVSFALMKEGLIDDLRLWMYPLLLGSAGPQLPHFLKCAPTRFDLSGTRTLPNGIVVLSYRPHPAE